MLTNDQWTKIDKKYAKLMYKISHQISGDTAIANFDDNLQDIRIAAMDAVVGFEKQNEGANGSFDEFWGSKGFDQYIKTCMWTKKNNKGAKITKKAPILKGTVSTEVEEVLALECPSCGDPSDFFEEISLGLTMTQESIIDLAVKDSSLVKPSGKLNVQRIAEELGMTWYETKKHVSSLASVLQNEL